jgi:hypothetical protein
MARLRIKVCMNIIFIVSDIYAHFLIPKITRVTQYRNNVDIKIKLIRYDPNGVPCFFFMNSATCIFSGLYAIYVLDLHWQQSFVYITRCRNTQSVRNKVIHKNYVFFVTSSRAFRFGRNKELVLTNKQKQCCKNLLFLRECVKSNMEGMFTNKNYRKKRQKMYLRYLQTPRLLISTIHVKLNMFKKVFHWGYIIQTHIHELLRCLVTRDIFSVLRIQK